MNVKIIVATHKKYAMPTDEMYIPVHVGADGKFDEYGKELDLGYIKDNTGDNISSLNPSFCGLTGLLLGVEKSRRGLYWACPLQKAFFIKKDKNN